MSSTPSANLLQVPVANHYMGAAPTGASQTDATSQVLFSKSGQASGASWAPKTDSLEADQPAATEALRQSFFDHNVDKIAESIARKQWNQEHSDPSSLETRGRSAAKAETVDLESISPRGRSVAATDPEKVGVMEAPSHAEKADDMPPFEKTVSHALETLGSNRREKVAFGVKALVDLAKSLPENVNLGIPKDLKFHDVKVAPKHNMIVFDMGDDEDQIALSFSVKKGKLVVRLEGQTAKDRDTEKAIKSALKQNEITGSFSTQRGEKGRDLTFNATSNIASVAVTSKGVVLSRK